MNNIFLITCLAPSLVFRDVVVTCAPCIAQSDYIYETRVLSRSYKFSYNFLVNFQRLRHRWHKHFSPETCQSK